MVYGTVDYNHHDGSQKGTEWAARVKLAEEGGKLKMALYHVFLVSLAYDYTMMMRFVANAVPHRTLRTKSNIRGGRL